MFHHINYRLVRCRQLDVCTFIAVNSSNKRQNYDTIWHHIEVCNDKFRLYDYSSSLNKSNTRGGGVVEQEQLSLTEHLCSPLSKCILRFRVSTIFGSSFPPTVLDFFFQFLTVHIFKMLFDFTSVQHDFHVRWYITSGTGTVTPSTKIWDNPGFVNGSFCFLFIGVSWYVWYFVDHCLYFCLFLLSMYCF